MRKENIHNEELLQFVPFTKYYWSDQIRVEMARVCGRHGKDETSIHNLNGRESLEETGMHWG
jgi:hypothetical protein